ncbi:MAG: fructose-6-phosphate aldolase [Calditrichaeota bacterium]|nr:fructose-6-phosphate aldolase [Calditrichota bacterium]
MKFFIDTANLAQIRDASAMGVLDGVTTNPSLVAKEGKPYEPLLKEICELVDGPVSAEVTATDLKGMLREGKKLAKIHPNIVVKLPITRDGVAACVELARAGIHTNMTLCFTPLQALVVAKAGASFVSPFVGRLDDISFDGMQLIRDIVQIYDNYDFGTQVLVASVRHPVHLLEAALAGADIATIPYDVITKILSHPLTDAGLQKFLDDWKKGGQKI